MRRESSLRHWIKLPGKATGRALPLAAAAMAIVLAGGMSALALTDSPAHASLAANSAAAGGEAAYLNPQLPIQARVSNLLAKMTLPEKIGQMVQIEATQVTDTSNTCTSQGGFNLPNPVCEQ